MQGICELLEEKMKRDHGLEINPLTDVVICCGQTEAFMAAIFAGKVSHVFLGDLCLLSISPANALSL